MVRTHPDPLSFAHTHGAREREDDPRGGVAQLGEHLLCKQGVIGSIPFTSTTLCRRTGDRRARVSILCPLKREWLFFNNLEEVCVCPGESLGRVFDPFEGRRGHTWVVIA
jgi:hypothetical protein